MVEERTLKRFLFTYEDFLEKLGLKGKGELKFVTKDVDVCPKCNHYYKDGELCSCLVEDEK